MSVMTKLADAIKSSTVDLSQDLDLPLHLTNIYACSVYSFSGREPVHTYIAGIHTRLAVDKLSEWCDAHHGFRPLRSTARTPVRRLKMVDLIENPEAYDVALQNAKDLKDQGIVYALRQLPQWIAEQTGVAIPAADIYAASGLVLSLANTLSRLTRKGASV